MSFKKKSIQIVVGKVVKEKKSIVGGHVEGLMIPSELFKYDVSTNSDEYKVHSFNQRFTVGDPATLIIDENNKAELMYHKLGVNARPFVLSNPDLTAFFGTTPPTTLKTFFYQKKFKLFGGTKKVEKMMLAGQHGTKAEGLVMKFETGSETHTPGKTRITTILTLLIKNDQEYFVAKAKSSIKSTRKEGFQSSSTLGLSVNVVFDPQNKACVAIFED